MPPPAPAPTAANPFAGQAIFSVTAGTLLAILLIPDEFHTPGALQSSAVAQTIGLLYPVGRTAVRRTRDLFRGENILSFGCVYWIELDLLQGVNEPTGVPLRAVQIAFAATGLLAAGVWAGVAFPAWRLPQVVRTAASTRLSGAAVFGATVACFVLAMANYVVACDFDFGVMWAALTSGSRWSAPWASGALGGWSAFREHLVYFGYLVPTLTVLTAVVYGWASAQAGAGLAMSAVILLFASQGGTRGEIGVIVNAAVICWLLQQPRLHAGHFVRAGLTVGLLLVVMQVMLTFRNEGWLNAFASGADRLQETTLDRIHVDDNFYRLCQVIDLMPDRIDHSYGAQLTYVAVRPIPRALWPGKPVGPGFRFETFAVGHENLTLSVSAVGEFYYDFGLPFVFLGGLFYGRLAGVWDQLLGVRRGGVWPVLYGLGAMALFVAIRSQQAFVVRTYPILFWLVLDALFFRSAARRGDV